MPVEQEEGGMEWADTKSSIKNDITKLNGNQQTHNCRLHWVIY